MVSFMLVPLSSANPAPFGWKLEWDRSRREIGAVVGPKALISCGDVLEFQVAEWFGSWGQTARSTGSTWVCPGAKIRIHSEKAGM